MKRFLIVLVLAAAVMMVAGCGGTLDRSKINFNIQNAENPEIVFVIEDKHFSDRVPSSNIGRIELASLKEIGSAIISVFKGKQIAIYTANEIIKPAWKTVMISPIEFDLYKPWGFFYKCEFTADITINSSKKRLMGKSEKGVTPFKDLSETEVIEMTTNAFWDFAKNLKKELGM